MFLDYPKFSHKYQNYTNIDEKSMENLQKFSDLCGQLIDQGGENPFLSFKRYDLCEPIRERVFKITREKFPHFNPMYMPSDFKENLLFEKFLNDIDVQKVLKSKIKNLKIVTSTGVTGSKLRIGSKTPEILSSHCLKEE